jgi:site-specific DNA recombinase
VIAGIAAWEREEIAARVAASVPVRAKLGKPLGGAAPFGYLWKERKLVPHPDEAPIRRLIYELFREHKRLKTVGQTLTSRGYRTRRGKRFSDTTLRRLIEDSTAKGEHLANYTRSRGDGKSWDLKPAGEWVTTAVEPLVTAELWAECNTLLAERTRTRKPPTKRPVNLFAGLVHCTCGGTFRVPSSIPNKYVCNECHRKIPIVDLERLFQTELERFVLSPEAVAAHLADGDAVLAGKEELLTALLGERERLAREAEKLYRLYLADALSVEGFGAKHRPLEERLRQLDEEVPRLQGEIDYLKMSLLNQADVLSEAHDLYHRFGDLPFEDRRAIVEAIVERITIGGEEIELALAALPPFPKMTAFGQRTPTVAFISCHVTLRGRKARPGYPAEAKTVGERLDGGIQQKDAAKAMGCDPASSIGKRAVARPRFRFWPAILAFLATTTPGPEPESLAGRIRTAREAEGLVEEALARQLGLEPGTVAAWERDEVRRPYPHIRQVFERWFATLGYAGRLPNFALGTCLCYYWRLFPKEKGL